GHGRAHVAHVAHAVGVAVRLVGVGHRRAVVAGVAHAVGVGVRLVGVGHQRAVVAGVAHAVPVGVLLVGVRHLGAVVHRVGHAVAGPVDGEGDRAREEGGRGVLAGLVAPAHAVAARRLLRALPVGHDPAGVDHGGGRDRRVVGGVVRRVGEVGEDPG